MSTATGDVLLGLMARGETDAKYVLLAVQDFESPAFHPAMEGMGVAKDDESLGGHHASVRGNRAAHRSEQPRRWRMSTMGNPPSDRPIGGSPLLRWKD